MNLPNSASGRPVYRGSQFLTISDFVFTTSIPGGWEWIALSIWIEESKFLVITALGVAFDMVEHDLVASEDQARRDRPTVGPGDDDPLVPAEALGRGNEVSWLKSGADELEFLGRRRHRGRGWSSREFRARGCVTEIRPGPGACTTNAASGLAIRKLQPPISAVGKLGLSESRGVLGPRASRAVPRSAILGIELDRPRRARHHGGW